MKSVQDKNVHLHVKKQVICVIIQYIQYYYSVAVLINLTTCISETLKNTGIKQSVLQTAPPQTLLLPLSP